MPGETLAQVTVALRFCIVRFSASLPAYVKATPEPIRKIRYSGDYEEGDDGSSDEKRVAASIPQAAWREAPPE